MSDTDDIASLMDALKEDSKSFNGVIIPVNDRNFDGAGIEDAQAGMSRMATAMDLQSVAGITPPSSWEQFGTILVNDLLPRITAEEVLKRVAGALVPGSALVLDPVYLRAGRTILADLPTFGSHAAEAYSDYIEESAVGIVDLIQKVAAYMIEQEGFAFSLATLSISMPAKALVSVIFDPQSTLAQAVMAADADALLTEIAMEISQLPGADVNLTMALAVVESLRYLRNLFSEIVSMEPAELFDLIGEVPLFVAEMMRDQALQAKMEEVVDSAAMLGDIFGTLIGIVIWEIIEEVVTMGMAKPMKLLKVAT